MKQDFLHITNKRFENLELKELYDLLSLRSEVFVVEQDCVYQDIDQKDQNAIHLLGYSENNRIVAYARVFYPNDYFSEASIGRVVVHKDYRDRKYGKQIMVEAINFLKQEKLLPIRISAQCYLNKFYTELGFTKVGENYLEDGIPHQAMLFT